MNSSTEDGEANITVLRKLSDEFPAEVAWTSRNGDAFYPTHYLQNQGGNSWRI